MKVKRAASGISEVHRWWHAFIRGHWQYVYQLHDVTDETITAIKCECGEEWLA